MLEKDSIPTFCRGDTPWQGKLRVMWIWHAGVVGEYQKPLAVLARCPGLELSLLVPHRWPERAGEMVRAERLPGASYRLITARTVLTGLYYLYFFPSLIYQL